MTKAATKRGGQGPRARHMGVNRIEQAARIREILSTIPAENRKLDVVKAKLHDKGINLTDTTIYAHLKKLKKSEASNGEAGEAGLMDRVEAVSRAMRVCGGADGLFETIKFVKRIGKVLQ